MTTTPRLRATTTTQSGFTLIEVLVVILVLGLITRIVVANLGALLPESSLDSQANRFRSWVEYLRSEAKIQGKPYSLELDLKENRTRLVLPPEDKLVTTEEDTVAATVPMDWTPLEKWVKFHGHAIAGREIHTRKRVLITFDENGFTADQAVFFVYDDADEKRVWTVRIDGLSGTTEVIKNREGDRMPAKSVEQGAF